MSKKKELTVEERLDALYQLQTTLSKIDEIKILRGELPLEVQDLEDEIAGLNTRISNNKEEIDEIKKTLAGKKIKIDEAEVSIEKYNNQLENVRNNKEYDILSKDIEYQNLNIELYKKNIKDLTDESKAKKEELEKSKLELEDREKEFEIKKNELGEIITETKQDEEKLREQAKKLEEKIEPRLLQSYKRIRKNSRNGLGIVYVQRDACGGCFNKIPPQRQLDIRSRKKIIVCEYCGRILIDPELAGINLEEVQDAKAKKKKAIRKKKA